MAIITVTAENFDEEVLKSEDVVLVDFWAAWCGPCMALSPVIDEMALEVASNVKICKLNVDENNDLARQFRVMSIPTCVFIKDGVEVDRFVGARNKSDYLAQFQAM